MSAEEIRSSFQKWPLFLCVLMALAMGVQSLILFKLWQERPRERLIHRTLGPGETSQGSSEEPSTGSPGRKQAAPHKGNHPFADLDELWPTFDAENWDPLDEMKRMREHMESMFDDSFGRFRLSPGGSRSADHLFRFAPKLDLQEKDDCYVASMDMPGANKNDISVKLDDRVLTVSGQIQETVEKKDHNQLLRKERRSGSFERTVTLPGPVVADKMDASYENGVLAITIPKAKEDQQSKTIQVK